MQNRLLRRWLKADSQRLWAIFRPGESRPSSILIRASDRFGGSISRRSLSRVTTADLGPTPSSNGPDLADWSELLARDDEYDELVDELVEVAAFFPLSRPTEGIDTLDQPLQRLRNLVEKFETMAKEVKERYDESVHIIPDEPTNITRQQFDREMFTGCSEEEVHLAISVHALTDYVDGSERSIKVNISATVNRLLVSLGYSALPREKVFDPVRRAERMLKTEKGRSRLVKIPTVPSELELLVLNSKLEARRTLERILKQSSTNHKDE